MDYKGFSTKSIHTSYARNDAHNALQMPIYSNAAFEFDSAEYMEAVFLGQHPDHTYSRISNPTVENLERRIMSITGGFSASALSSGMAAISNVFFAIAGSGKNIVTSRHLFGNTYSFFTSTLKSFGVDVNFVDLNNSAEVKQAIDENTIAIFFETITNPQLEIVDIEELSRIAKEHQIVLIADTTLTPPNIFKASDFGINIEIISSTKIISGGATSIGGIIIDYGNYDWSHNTKLGDLAIKFGPFALKVKLRKEIQRNLGACLSPFNAYLQSLGLETLALRFNKSVNNCRVIAEYLQNKQGINKVNYPGLATSDFYTIGLKQFGNFPGAVLTINFQTKQESFTFINNLKLIHRATNIYDNRSVIIHPASTIFCDFSSTTRQEIGVPDTMVRLSVGIEDVEDIIADIEYALN